MITYIRMQNFKSWRDSGNVPLAPLTGFFGTNSSGKSSLLQMLLLLKQTAECSNIDKVIFWGDNTSLVNLGSFREVIHRHLFQSSLGFEFACKLTHPRPLYEIPEDGSPWQQTIDRFAFDSLIQVENGKLVVKKLMYGHSPKGVAEIVWEEGKASFPNQHINKYEMELETCYGILSQGTSETGKFLRKFSSAFEELFSHVYYLGPTRVHPRRLYHWEKTHPKEIDVWGNEAVDALLSARVRQLTTAHNGKKVSIEERISKWLQKMELAHSFSLAPQGSLDDNNYEICIQKTQNSSEVTLADMGHGVADLFPLLVHCCYVPEGSTLILEQPGIHLHPKAQADLADLLIEAITERNLQILIESHSEHLLTRLQLRIAEGKIPVSETALYFCENENGVSSIKPLDIDELGNIKNWPKNFFGDVRGDLVKMTREQTKRQKKAEG
ncbi:DUF3696 domain-containing protein [Candidatus Poribacteria bacterium]|nr:DUF3696 domain-containing protein [Candidatus Poribacteria bacterium]